MRKKNSSARGAAMGKELHNYNAGKAMRKEQRDKKKLQHNKSYTRGAM
jgi:hypothetical protein